MDCFTKNKLQNGESMTTATDIAHQPAVVKALLKAFSGPANALLEQAAAGAMSAKELEEGVWSVVVSLGRAFLGACMATACKHATEADIAARGLTEKNARLRLDRDYHARQMSTFGPIEFPLFAYREHQGTVTVTRVPARESLLPIYRACRSTVLCLEWEARLGKEFPFRRAASALTFFSHGAVQMEDTTLATHAVAIGSVIDRKWLYRPVDEIRRLLDERATRDNTTGQPIIYLSQDGHSERRYVDETWAAAWKNMNGLRIWAVDRHRGGIIHIGGEYTWGDCNQVGAIIEALIADGILARDGDYGQGTLAELVIVTDGLPWIEDHIVSRLPWAHVILDLYHALEHISAFARSIGGAGTKAAAKIYRRFAALLAPPRRRKRKKSSSRKGHRKGKARRRTRKKAKFGSIWDLQDALIKAEAELVRSDEDREAFTDILRYVGNNAYRGEYVTYRQRGFQIGSGAMESLHRTAAQMRLKLPGARWLKSTSLALVNLRLLDLVGRWDEFWRHDDLADILREAFSKNAHTAS